MMTPNLPHLSTKMLGHLDSNAPYLMPLSPISMIYLTSTQQPAPRHFHTAPLLTSLPLKSFNSPRSQNIKWRTTGSKMPSHLSNFHQKTWLTSFPLNSLTHPPSTWHPIHVIFTKKPWHISLDWLMSLPLTSLPSNEWPEPRHFRMATWTASIQPGVIGHVLSLVLMRMAGPACFMQIIFSWLWLKWHDSSCQLWQLCFHKRPWTWKPFSGFNFEWTWLFAFQVMATWLNQ